MASNTGSSEDARALTDFWFSSLLSLCPSQRSYLSSDFSQIWYVDSFCQEKEQVVQSEVIYAHARQFTSGLAHF